MATDNADIWNALEFAATALGGVWAGVKAASHWFTKREAAMKQSILDVETHFDKEVVVLRDRSHKQGNDIAANTLAIAVMKTEHGATQDRLAKIERSIDKIDDKQDEQTELLLKIASKMERS